MFAGQLTTERRKKIVYMAKRLNFTHGNLDIRGMEQKLQRYAYKNFDGGETNVNNFFGEMQG